MAFPLKNNREDRVTMGLGNASEKAEVRKTYSLMFQRYAPWKRKWLITSGSIIL